MPPPVPYVREAGSGTSIVCIHSSASSSGQWRPLMERLADRFRVIAVDLYGSGKTPAWPDDRPMHLDDEVALLEPVFRSAGERFHLVGHSFGGAIALKAALGHSDRLLSLVLYEPVLFSVLISDAPETAPAREILSVRDDTTRLVSEGNLTASAQRFIDYWMGDGAWAATPEPRRTGLAAAMSTVIPEWHAAFHEPTPLRAFAAVDVPTLLLTGTRSKASARAVARLLMQVLPRVHVEEIAGAGHMAPVTHPDRVNPLIERFLEASQPPASFKHSLATIRSETDADVDGITEVTVAAFQTLAISDHTEQFIVTALRAAKALTISLVAELDGRVIGHIAFSPVAISDGTRDWYGLGPVSVLPEYQRQGIGKALIQEGLSRLKKMNARGCCLVGHPEYYKKFGFKNEPGLEVEGVPPEVFFALSFDGHVPQGTVTFHEAFKANE